jgi:ribosomal protein L40E
MSLFPMRQCRSCGARTTSTSTLDMCVRCGDQGGLRPRHSAERRREDEEEQKAGYAIAVGVLALANWARARGKEQQRVLKNYPAEKLYAADPNCKHEVVAEWSGVKCRKCPGWFCL